MTNTQRGRITAALIAAAAVGATAAVWMRASTNPSAIDTLVAAAPRSERTIEARLSGNFPWAPHRPSTVGREASRGGAGQVLAMTRGRMDAASLHAAGVAKLLLGDDASALVLLRRAARKQPTAQTLTDYAAALISASMTEGRADYLPDALSAVDRALEIDSRFPPALFNRALVIEKLFLRKQAARAWSAYLAVDADSSWASEAHWRRNEVDRKPALAVERQQTMAAIAFRDGDREELLRFVDDFREPSRLWIEELVLPSWATATREADRALSAQELVLARVAGKSLLALAGDPYVADLVAAVENSTDSRRADLVSAYRCYRDGRHAQASLRFGESETLLTSAAQQFERCGSPMSYHARAAVADVLLAQHRGREARALLRSLRTLGAATQYVSLQANLQRQLARAESVDGNWSAALNALRTSVTSFAVLGDTASKAEVHAEIADIYASIGNRRLAWQERIVALATLREDMSDPRVTMVMDAIRGETSVGHTDTALSLLEVIADADTTNGALLLRVHQARASMWARRGDRRRAFAALEKARQTTRGWDVRRETLSLIEDSLQVTEAEIIAATDPARALSLLDAARSASGLAERQFPPIFELQRARALRHLSCTNAAVDALVHGIDAVESKRKHVAEDELRTSVLDFAEPLFRELVDVLATNGVTERAFEYADRWRARTLLDSLAFGETRPPAYSPIAPQLAETVPPGEAILEYVILEDRLLIFCVTRRGVELTTVQVSPDRLQEVAEAFTASIVTGLPGAHAPAASAYDMLIRPVAHALSGVTTLVFVPDRFLQRVPFAALYDRGRRRFLIEDYSLALSPSAQLLFTHAPHRREVVNDVLVVGNPDTSGALHKLTYAEREARFVAALYSSHSIALGREATRERFLREWPASRIVHFSGHAANERNDASTASLALSGHEDASFVTVQDITAASRTIDSEADPLLSGAPLAPATQLVVLAACDTFAGREEHFEGTPTLAHAFLAAGIPSVVGALWKIEDDDAHTLFTAFHRHVANGVPVANALRQAQLAMLYGDEKGQRHPSSWAAITLAGVPSLTVFRGTTEVRHKMQVADLR